VRLLDGLAPLGEGALDMARDGRDTERVLVALQPDASSFELGCKGLTVGGAGLFLGLVELAPDDRAPAAVAAWGEVEDEGVGVQLRVGLAAGVIIELRHQKPGGLLARGSGAATPAQPAVASS
jgi:hypothetical protein